jgi:hypothetical protein
MKIRSLLLGSAAAVGLATGAYAADGAVSVISALSACDALGLSGITISSDTNCIQISGEVKWEGNWGDYHGNSTQGTVSAVVAPTVAGNNQIQVPATSGIAAGTVSPSGTVVAGTPADAVVAATPYGTSTIATPGASATGNMDWESRLEWNITIKATADTANGPASAVVHFRDRQQWQTVNQLPVNGSDSPYDTDPWPEPGTGGDHTFGIKTQEAYVTVGASNILIVGLHDSLMNKGDDEPFGLFQTYNSDKVDKGVNWTKDLIPDGGVLVGVTSDLGNGLFGTLAVENLQSTKATAGTLVGVLEYKGDGISAHVTGAAGGILDGVIENYGVHAGFTATFDPVTIRAAIAADNSGYVDALATGMVTLDMFTLAGTVEGLSNGDWSVAGSISAAVTDGVTVTGGGRYYHDATPGVSDGYQAELQVAAAVTETVKLTGGIGVYGTNTGATVPYGALEAAYAPGGGFTSSAKIQVLGNGAYKGTLKAGKTF